MTIDARKLMADKGVKVEAPKPLDEKVQADLEVKRSNAQKEEDDLSEQELIEKNEDNMRSEKKLEKKKNEAYDSISENDRADAISEQLGFDDELV
jgi:hypothetical protein